MPDASESKRLGTLHTEITENYEEYIILLVKVGETRCQRESIIGCKLLSLLH